MPKPCNMRGMAFAAAAAFLLFAAFPPAPAVAASVPGTSCQVFPPDNVWNMDVSALPVNAKDRVWKKAMHAPTTNLHPDFGPPSYGIPFDVVDNSHPFVSPTFTYADESDPGPYPFGPDIHIEGGSDRHAIMVDRSTCMLYELYGATWNGGRPPAGSGGLFHLHGSHPYDPRPAPRTPAAVTGLPHLPR